MNTIQELQLTEKTFKADKQHVKAIGRTFYNQQKERWCVGTCSGIEFSMTGRKVCLHVAGDNFVSDPEQKDAHARMAVYINEEIVLDTMIDEAETDYLILDKDASEKVVVRVLKLSESAFGDFAITDITVLSEDEIHPTPVKEHKIEFIGDSITCGYGVENDELEGIFRTSTENGTKSYAYKTIKALDVDYSICSASGFGIVSGYTDDKVKVEDQLIPPYYDKISFSRSTHRDGVNPCERDWDFSSFQPEAIIINLGTNDTSYAENNEERMEEYTLGYIEFLKKVRKNNPTAKIICILGIMGNALYPCVEDAVSRYSELAQDKNVVALQFEEQKEEDGCVLHWHPSELTHRKASEILINFVKNEMGW